MEASDTGGTMDDSPKMPPKSARKGGKGTKLATPPKVAQLNPTYHDSEFKAKLFHAFQQKEHVENENGCVLHSEPFAACEMPNLIADDSFLDGLKDELLDQIFHDKNNDLYKFQQSDDLKKLSTPHVKGLRKLLYEGMRSWLTEVTGIPLNNKVALFCARYDHTDTLLCHDDELEGRRIAYILYLVPPWRREDGGQLDLFDMDEHGQPRDVVKSIVPQCNSFVWFEVTPASFHQVGEVLTEDKTRLSLSGWFHGPPIVRPTPFVEIPRPLKSHLDIDESLVYEWLNPIYLEPDVQGQIQDKFEKDSEIELQGFLREEKYQELMSALESKDICWTKRGPANKRHYGSGEEDSFPEVLVQCINFLQSEAMFLTLSNLTGLSLHELAANNDSDNNSDAGSYTEMAPSGSKESVHMEQGSDGETQPETSKPHRKRRKLDSTSKGDGVASDGEVDSPPPQAEASVESKTQEFKGNPRCRAEVRRWRHGCYTLVHDTDAEGAEFALDALLFASCKGWQQDFGGYTSYIARGEDEELLTVNPAENSLALVYRDKDTLRFAKHVNSRIKEMHNGQGFYDISLTYFE